jgi:hypothetical protein
MSNPRLKRVVDPAGIAQHGIRAVKDFVELGLNVIKRAFVQREVRKIYRVGFPEPDAPDFLQVNCPAAVPEVDDASAGRGRDRDARIACQVFGVEPDPLYASCVEMLRHGLDMAVLFARNKYAPSTAPKCNSRS